MPLTGRNVLIMVGPDFEDRELIYPLYRLQEAGAKVTLGGIGDSQYKGKYGIPITIDAQMETLVHTPWDAVIVPGGWAPDKIRMNEAALQIIRATVQRSHPVAAICHGGWVLASAKVLQGRTVTSYKAIQDDMVHAGATWIDQDVVVDGPLITSRTPADLPVFCRAIIEVMERVPALI